MPLELAYHLSVVCFVVRNENASRDDFIFYSKRLMRILIEHALSLLPFKVSVVFLFLLIQLFWALLLLLHVAGLSLNFMSPVAPVPFFRVHNQNNQNTNLEWGKGWFRYKINLNSTCGTYLSFKLSSIGFFF